MNHINFVNLLAALLLATCCIGLAFGSPLNLDVDQDDETDLAELAGPYASMSNIANAKIELSPLDKATAAGHHYHHGHHVHGMLKMGAETGKKGAFKWHDKHPVGGKGRR